MRTRLVLLFAVIIFGGLSVGAECCQEVGGVAGCGASPTGDGAAVPATPPSGGGGGGGGGDNTTIYKSVTYPLAVGDGRYSMEVTLTGHTITNGVKDVFDQMSAETTGEEICIGTATQTDWYSFDISKVYDISPMRVMGEGGYADDWYDCLLGQALWGYAEWEWRNTLPYVADDGRDARCHELRGTGGESLCGPEFPPSP